MKKYPLIAVLALPLLGCGTPVNNETVTADLNKVDTIAKQVQQNAAEQNLEHILTIDHARLAAKDGEHLDASRVEFFADNALNTELLQENIMAGLDLPLRVLSYSEDRKIKTMYTDSNFLAKRHGLSNQDVLKRYDLQVEALVEGSSKATMAPTNNLTKGYGIQTVNSDYNFDTTIERIKHDVLEEDDTVWFMDWDYQEQASKLGETLPKATLLVFGGPAPGAKAMTDFSSIGLDAFGQKVLVFEQDGKVKIAYNDIVDFAQLHYQDSAIAHRVINYRVGSTLKGAVIERH